MLYQDQNGQTEQAFLASYRAEDYERPSVACDMVIFTVTQSDADNYRKNPEKELCVLLIERGGHPFRGCWALPGGFVRPGETTARAAVRELREETGLENVYLEQLYTFSDPGRDPRTWVMSCAHLALIDSSKVRLKAGDDARRAAWFRLICRTQAQDEARRWELLLQNNEAALSAAVLEQKSPPPNGEERFTLVENDGLAFDHAKILVCALERLRGKLEDTDLALHLMPETFTLTELQQVYEVILGRPLLKAAFRRKIAPLVRETGRFTENAGHRPSQLYERREGNPV